MTTLIGQARAAAGLTLVDLAERAGTSHSTLSFYERGIKQPRLDTAERVLAAAGFHLQAVSVPTYEWHQMRRGRPFAVPSSLPRLAIEAAFAKVLLPVDVDWSGDRRAYNLADRSDRLLCYETVLRQGGPDHISTFVDGALLVDAWPDMHLPQVIRDAWRPLVQWLIDGRMSDRQ